MEDLGAGEGPGVFEAESGDRGGGWGEYRGIDDYHGVEECERGVGESVAIGI